MTECERKILDLYERLTALVLRDVIIGQANLKEALGELDRLCIEASGKKSGGVRLAVRGPVTSPTGESIRLETKQISAWEALKQIR